MKHEVRITTEVCVDSRSGASAALAAGAHRIELCQELAVGGLTPSFGLLDAVLELNIPTIVLVRPRAGDFVYQPHEVDIVARDIQTARKAGVHGVAIGALQPDGQIDRVAMEKWCAAADGVEVCFHRAFDGTRDPLEALAAIHRLGLQRVLTSGQEARALAGAERIAEWVNAAPPGLEIMPGGGVRAENIAEVLERSGARQIHFSARRPVDSPVTHHNPRCDLHDPRHQTRQETHVEEIERYLRAIEQG